MIQRGSILCHKVYSNVIELSNFSPYTNREGFMG